MLLLTVYGLHEDMYEATIYSVRVRYKHLVIAINASMNTIYSNNVTRKALKILSHNSNTFDGAAYFVLNNIHKKISAF